MKLSSSHHSSITSIRNLWCALNLVQQFAASVLATDASGTATAQSVQAKLIERCCHVGKERAIESQKFNCKLSAKEALAGQLAGRLQQAAADSLIERDQTLADQCEMVLESCCMAHHRTRNCEAGKQFAKSGAACMDVELSKEATIATESFNDCCMSCSLGVLAAKNPSQNESTTTTGNRNQQSGNSLASRCKLISPLASSLSGQLYEQTYVECCQENLPRLSNALVEPGAPIDCSQSNPCSQRCLQAGSFEPFGSPRRGRVEQDRCECFSGYKLASDGVNCVDVDECKLGQHSCNKHFEVCDNTRGSFRCLARSSSNGDLARLRHHHQSNGFHLSPSSSGHGMDAPNDESDSILRHLCPGNTRWSAEENRCQQLLDGSSTQQLGPAQRTMSAQLFALPVIE